MLATRANHNTSLVQLCIRTTLENRQIVPARCVSDVTRTKDLETFRDKIDKDLTHLKESFPHKDRLSPTVVGIPVAKYHELENLHHLLGLALEDVVNRWLSDASARLTERMPLNKSEEKLLRWIVDSGLFPAYADRAGCWRSDVLFGRSQDGDDDEDVVEAPFICEINGRLPLNGLLGMPMQAFGATALGAAAYGSNGVLELGNSLEESMRRIMRYFDSSKPLFCVREQWPGLDSRVLLALFQKEYGQPVANVRPQDLEARPDPDTPTGYALWDGATNTKMEQWVNELIQKEWNDACERDWRVGQQLALTPLNDFRTTMLVHDKRLLGILPEELPGMVERGVLSADEAETVGRAIPETLNPGSEGLKALLEKSKADPDIRNRYIYKSCRDGYGLGIAMGKDLSPEEWLSRLTRLASGALRPDQDAAVVQRLVDHRWYDIVRHELPGGEPNPRKIHLIASMYIFNARDFYMGPCRTGIDLHLGLSPGSTGIAMGVVRLPDWPLYEATGETS